jgi:hypothetical protein
MREGEEVIFRKQKRKLPGGEGNCANANEGGWDAIVRNGRRKKTNCHIGNWHVWCVLCAPVSRREEMP